LENTGGKRTISAPAIEAAVNSPVPTTFENNNKIQQWPKTENQFSLASGGGSGPASEPSLGLECTFHSYTVFRDKHRSEQVPPKPDGFVADINTTFEQQIFNVTER
jgi:hypothetical protein